MGRRERRHSGSATELFYLARCHWASFAPALFRPLASRPPSVGHLCPALVAINSTNAGRTNERANAEWLLAAAAVAAHKLIQIQLTGAALRQREPSWRPPPALKEVAASSNAAVGDKLAPPAPQSHDRAAARLIANYWAALVSRRAVSIGRAVGRVGAPTQLAAQLWRQVNYQRGFSNCSTLLSARPRGAVLSGGGGGGGSDSRFANQADRLAQGARAPAPKPIWPAGGDKLSPARASIKGGDESIYLICRRRRFCRSSRCESHCLAPRPQLNCRQVTRNSSDFRPATFGPQLLVCRRVSAPVAPAPPVFKWPPLRALDHYLARPDILSRATKLNPRAPSCWPAAGRRATGASWARLL